MQQALFEEVKNQLNITWSDEATDRKINSIIARAIGVLNGYAGQVLDINVDENINGDAQLLIDCCRYIYITIASRTLKKIITLSSSL